MADLHLEGGSGGGSTPTSSSSSGLPGYFSPIDFTAVYASGTTLTLGGNYPTITDVSQIDSVKQFDGISGNLVATYTEGFLYSDPTLTVSSSTFTNTDVFRVVVSDKLQAFDQTNDLLKIQEQSPLSSLQTDPSNLVTAQDLIASSYASFGVVDCRNKSSLGLYVTRDINDSENVLMKLMARKTSGGVDYEIDGLSVKTLWTTTAGSIDGTTYYEFDTGTIPFLNVTAIAGTLGGTPGDLTIDYDLKWR